jgi:hypothetical protein
MVLASGYVFGRSNGFVAAFLSTTLATFDLRPDLHVTWNESVSPGSEIVFVAVALMIATIAEGARAVTNRLARLSSGCGRRSAISRPTTSS